MVGRGRIGGVCGQGRRLITTRHAVGAGNRLHVPVIELQHGENVRGGIVSIDPISKDGTSPNRIHPAVRKDYAVGEWVIGAFISPTLWKNISPIGSSGIGRGNHHPAVGRNLQGLRGENSSGTENHHQKGSPTDL